VIEACDHIARDRTKTNEDRLFAIEGLKRMYSKEVSYKTKIPKESEFVEIGDDGTRTTIMKTILVDTTETFDSPLHWFERGADVRNLIKENLAGIMNLPLLN